MSIKTFVKDPNAKLDYMIDWAAWLGADTIATSTWVTPAGLTATSPSNTTTTATVWLESGTVGSQYLVTNRITTAGGRTNDRSILIQVSEQ
jgi:hypothetical protein